MRNRNQHAFEDFCAAAPGEALGMTPRPFAVEHQAVLYATPRSASTAPARGSVEATPAGPVTRYAATGTPDASASRMTLPNASARLGNTNRSARSRHSMPPTIIAGFRAKEVYVWVARRGEVLTAPHHRPRRHLPRARHIEREEIIKVLFLPKRGRHKADVAQAAR